MNILDPIVTIITPTTGKDSLFRLIDSIIEQKTPVCHILLWDDVKVGKFKSFEDSKMRPSDLENKYSEQYNYYNIINIDIKHKMTNGIACGSALRSIGLMSAFTSLVTFADDDVTWDSNHLCQMINAIQNKNWAYCKRKIWNELENGKIEYIGVDNFESVGENAKTPYKMIDNNSMIFKRELGTLAAYFYRETTEYNDDRLMYDFLKKHAGEPGKTDSASVNQICPKRLYKFFKDNCDRE